MKKYTIITLSIVLLYLLSLQVIANQAPDTTPNTLLSNSNNCSTLNHGNGKIPFDGDYVKVDSLGNVCTKENGVWKSFFPMLIYPGKTSKRNDYAEYTVDGRFNTMIAWNVDKMQMIKDAGMKSLLNTDIYQETAQFEGQFSASIRQIKERGLMNNLLFYYTDYESIRKRAWDWHEEKKSIIAQEDPNGHPNYFLNGNSISNPSSPENIYNDGRDVADIIGTYSYERWDRYQPNGPKRVIQLEIGNQTDPAVIAHINYGVGGTDLKNYPRDPVGHRFTPIAMASVAQGAKGIAFWKDWGRSVGIAVEDNAWWADLPKFNADIKKMMDANIVQSLHNPFEIVCDSHHYFDKYDRDIVLDNIYEQDKWGYYLIPDDKLNVSVGTRLIDGKGYAIISNWNNTAQNFECTTNTSQMGYSFTKLYNFIDAQDNVGSVVDNTFQLTVPAYGWKVIKFL